MEKVSTYTEMSQMYDDEIEEINAALDIYIELLEKERKKGGKK